jgi:hypothetical protein
MAKIGGENDQGDDDATAGHRRGASGWRPSYRLELGLLLGPYLVGLLLLLFIVPVALTRGVAFTEFDALTPPRRVGWDNFLRIVRDRDFWNGLLVSLSFILLAIPLRVSVRWPSRCCCTGRGGASGWREWRCTCPR